MKDIDKLGKYENCLFEIRNRIMVIEDHLNGLFNEKYIITEVEFICLQFRKILEKIAMASLVANNEEYKKVNEKFAKNYHAERILRDLERVNKDFYPVPTKRKIVGLTPEGKSISEMIEIKEGFLNKEEFIKIYEKCGGMLHAINPYASTKNLDDIQKEFPEWLSKIAILINHHHIELCDGTALVGMLKRDDNGNPQAVIFAPVGENVREVI